MNNTVLDAHEAAEYLKVCYDTILRAARKKEVPSFKVRRRVMFRKESLDEWIRVQEEKALS